MNYGSIELTPLSQKMVLETGDYQSKLNEAKKHGEETARAIKKQGEDISKSLKESFQGVSKIGGEMQRLGGKLTLGVTTPLVALGKQAFDTYKSFDTAFRGVTKTIDMTEKETAQMKQAIRDLAKELPHSVESISAVAQAAGQLGIKKENILEFTETMLNLGVATNLTAEEAANSIARFANITGMSQDNFERFASTIVHLGNNFATTEAEIVAMSMRLAGAGAQAGMSEADIAALATTMSSLGIEAEAGGSALSKLINQIGVEVATNGERLSEFARISGLSVNEFKEKWGVDAVGALALFTAGLGKSEERGEDMNVLLDEMGIKEVRLSDAIRRLSGSQDLLTSAVGEGNKAWKENIALAKEADNFNSSVASKQTITWNEIRDKMIDLGEKLAPVFDKVLEVVKGVVEWFSSLDEGTQDLIIKFGLLAAAAGPVIAVLGTGMKVVGGLGAALVGLKGAGAVAGLTQVGAAAAGVSTATAGATAATGGLIAKLGAGAVALGPWALGIGAVVAGGVLLANTLNEEVVPSVDLFANETITKFEMVQTAQGDWVSNVQSNTITISDETKAQLGSYLSMSEGVRGAIIDMYTGVTESTEENVTNLTTKANELTMSIDQANQQRKDGEIATLTELFSETETMTEENKESIIGLVEDHYATRGMKLATLQSQEQAIYEEIKNSTTGITKAQADALLAIEEQKNKLAIEAMTQSNTEKEIILQRYGVYSKRLTAEQSSEVIKELNKQRDESVRLAEEEYAERVRVAENIRARGGTEANAAADEIIAAAQRQKDESLIQIEGIRADGIDKLSKSYEGLYSDIDVNTGKIKSTWDQLWQGIDGSAEASRKKIEDQVYQYNKLQFKDKYSTITFKTIHEEIFKRSSSLASHYNGLDAVPYDGYVARLHKGERVLTAREAEEGKKSNGDTNITIENFVQNTPQDIKRLAEELEFYRKQRQY